MDPCGHEAVWLGQWEALGLGPTDPGLNPNCPRRGHGDTPPALLLCAILQLLTCLSLSLGLTAPLASVALFLPVPLPAPGPLFPSALEVS